MKFIISTELNGETKSSERPARDALTSLKEAEERLAGEGRGASLTVYRVTDKATDLVCRLQGGGSDATLNAGTGSKLHFTRVEGGLFVRTKDYISKGKGSCRMADWDYLLSEAAFEARCAIKEEA